MALPPIVPNCSFNASASASPATPYRPTMSSPLASSPNLATTPPPLFPRDSNARLIQSSPIPAPALKRQPTHSKLAARQIRPNPVITKREVVQESRRKLFLRNVRQRVEDRRWEMRGGEQELLKLEWFSLIKELRRAKNADLDGLVLDSDIEEATRLQEEAMSGPLAAAEQELNSEIDKMMVDALEQQEQAELDALATSISISIPDEQERDLQRGQQQAERPPDSPCLSDDEDYDSLFMDYLLAQDQQNATQEPASSSVMDLS